MNRVAEKERRNNKVWYGWKNLCFLCSVLFCFSLTTLSLSLSAALPRGSYHIYIARERGSVCVMYVSEGVGSAWVLFSVCVRAWESVQVFLLSVKKMKGKEQKVVLWERGLFCVWEKDNMREIFTIYISIKLFHISSVSTVHVFNNQIDTEEPSPSQLVLTRYPLFSYYYTAFFLNLFIWVLSFLPMYVYIFLFLLGTVSLWDSLMIISVFGYLFICFDVGVLNAKVKKRVWLLQPI